MLMFLSILLMSLAVSAVCFALISAAAAAENKTPSLSPEIDTRPSRFFAENVIPAVDPRTIPAELLLSHIERHVRLEQAAAERFVSVPTLEALHAPSASTFVN